MSVTEKLISVDEDDTAERLLNRHFLKDLRGNIRAFAGQRFRCPNCESKYLWIPMSGRWRRCGNELILTVHKGSVEKYVDIARKITEEYEGVRLGNHLQGRSRSSDPHRSRRTGA